MNSKFILCDLSHLQNRFHILSNLKKYILLLFLLSSSYCINAQSITVNGTVKDPQGGALIGVNVKVKDAPTGVNTNAEGKFSLAVKSVNDILVFSYIGFVTQEITIGNRTIMDVVLMPNLTELEEVVVVGYGTQSKRTITGSIVEVKGDILERSPTVSITNSLGGRLPGVTALNRSGEPGSDVAQLLIRGKSTLGSTSPLVVIDGVAGRGGLDQISSRDIESISVLKDASAAIYGSRAANGVILITTKRGLSGKPMLNYTFNQGMSQPTRIPEYADAATLAEFQNQQLVEQNQLPKFTDAAIAKFRDGSDPLNYPNTNWRKAVMKDHTLQSQHNLSIGGGTTDAFKYYVSGSYSNQDGIFRNGLNNSKTVGLRSNTDSYISKNIRVSLDLATQQTNTDAPQSSASAIVESMYRNFPYLVDVYPNGLYGTGFSANENPLLMATGATGYNNSKTNRYQTKASIDINIPQVKGLGVDGFIAYDKTQIDGKTFQKPYTTYSYDVATSTYAPNTAGGVTSPQLSQQFNFASTLILNAKIKYSKTLAGEHRINSFVAVEQTEDQSNNFSAARKNYLTAEVDQLFAGGETDQVTGGSASEFARRNYFGRVGYQYKEKYLVDFTLRYDGSSAFPKDNRWGLFPGVSVGWIVSDEAFLKNSLSFVNNLKLRGSWGKMGNDAIAAFQYLASYTFTPGYIFGQTKALVKGMAPGVAPNPNITWEVANTTNVGLDAQLWNGLLGVNIDVFKSKRTNILTKRSASTPSFTGVSLPLENIGIVDNEGFELQLTHSRKTRNVLYSIGGNISYARNTVVDIDEAATVVDWQRQTGHVMGSTTYYINKGIYRTQAAIDASPHPAATRIGDLQYEDINLDGKIDSKDQVRLDRTNTPEKFFGINASVGYKNLDLNILLQGQADAWQYYFIPQGLFGNVLVEMANNRPTATNTNSKYPNLNYDEAQVSALRSDFWLRDASFIRLKNVELGYKLPKTMTDKIGINGLRVYMNGFNLLTIDKMKWFDPEGVEGRGANYPQSKIYNIGLNMTL